MQQASASGGKPIPSFAVAIAKVFTVGFALVFYVIVPGAMVLFYRSRHVKLTCEARDPMERWTDRCPLPVLAVVLIQAFGGFLLLLVLPVYGRAFPLFGSILTGVPAIGVYLVLSVISLYAARGFYRLQSTALWVYLGCLVVMGVNSVISFSGGGLMAMYEAVGLPSDQLELMRRSSLVTSNIMPWLVTATMAVLIGYVVWLKRYFSGKSR